MDPPPPYPGAGGWQPPPPYSEMDPSQEKINPYPPPQSQYHPPPTGGPWTGQGQMSAMVVLGGWDGDRALETVEMFDQRTGQWTFLPNMMGKIALRVSHNLLTMIILVPRRDHGAAVLGEFLYVVGGWNMDPYYNSTERFHVGTRTWSPGPPLSSARGWPGVAVLGW